MAVKFEVLVEGSFLELWQEANLQPVDNKKLVSLINDFEEGHWRYQRFLDFVFDNIAESALSFRERDALQDHPASLLRSAARNLRLTDAKNDFGKASELAEIVLYGIMKHRYGALPVVPKIFYKQNSQDNAKGADSVHIVLANGNDFELWLGEAKFLNSIEDSRFYEVVESVKASLTANKLKKENSIITSVSDLDLLVIDDQLRDSIKKALSQDTSIDDLKPRIRIPILLLHECAATASATEMTSAYRESLKQHHLDRALSYFAKQISALAKTVHKYSSIHFHLILFPVPSKDALVSSFLAATASLRT